VVELAAAHAPRGAVERRPDLEDAADARHVRAVGSDQALHEDHAARGAQQLGLALDPGAQRRRGEEIDLQVDRRQKSPADLGQVMCRDRQQHVAEDGHHAAVADAHRVAVARLDAKAQRDAAFELLHVQRAVDGDEAAAKAARLEVFGNIGAGIRRGGAGAR
jgi:hypothetical protein